MYMIYLLPDVTEGSAHTSPACGFGMLTEVRKMMCDLDWVGKYQVQSGPFRISDQIWSNIGIFISSIIRIE